MVLVGFFGVRDIVVLFRFGVFYYFVGDVEFGIVFEGIDLFVFDIVRELFFLVLEDVVGKVGFGGWVV